MIINNVGIIEYENEYEEFVIASIIEEKILKDMEIKSIYKRICPDKKHILDVKNIVKNVIARHYAEDSFYRKFTYILKHRVIQEKFSSKLLRNIEIERKTALDYILNKCKDFYIEELDYEFSILKPDYLIDFNNGVKIYKYPQTGLLIKDEIQYEIYRTERLDTILEYAFDNVENKE